MKPSRRHDSAPDSAYKSPPERSSDRGPCALSLSAWRLSPCDPAGGPSIPNVHVPPLQCQGRGAAERLPGRMTSVNQRSLESSQGALQRLAQNLGLACRDYGRWWPLGVRKPLATPPEPSASAGIAGAMQGDGPRPVRAGSFARLFAQWPEARTDLF
jgi:hypothetical protein